jgi:hypothetical protein
MFSVGYSGLDTHMNTKRSNVVMNRLKLFLLATKFYKTNNFDKVYKTNNFDT